MNFRQVLESTANEVTVLSYGYEEVSAFSRHFEPFRHKREIKFRIDREYDEEGNIDYNFSSLINNTFWFRCEEKESYYEENGKIYCDDPDLFSRASD